MLHNLSVPSLLILLSVTAACGDESNSEQNPAPPTEKTLCELKLNRSTAQDAIALLGSPSASSASDNQIFLYSYGDALLTLAFDEHSVFIHFSLVNIPQPACWTQSAEQTQ